MGAELARSAAGSEDNARIMTNVANLVYDAVGADGPRPVITRSMIERAIRKDGIERVLALAKLNMRGLYFDGKKSRVRYEKDGKTSHPTADHYTMVMQPDKKYCGFCTTNGKGDTDKTVRQKGRNALRKLLEIEEYHKEIARKREELYEVPKKRPIRKFHMPRLNFDAPNYWSMVQVKLTEKEMVGPYNPPKIMVFPIFTINYKGPTKYQQVTMPPLLAHMTAAQIDELFDSRLTSDFECHTQSVERGVATTAQSVKRRRTDASQLRMALSTVAAREELTENVTVKRFKDNFGQMRSDNHKLTNTRSSL